MNNVFISLTCHKYHFRESLLFSLIDLVSNVYELGKYIRKGETDQAVESAKKLSATRIQLQTKPRDNKKEERPIEYIFEIRSCVCSFILILSILIE